MRIRGSPSFFSPAPVFLAQTSRPSPPPLTPSTSSQRTPPQLPRLLRVGAHDPRPHAATIPTSLPLFLARVRHLASTAAHDTHDPLAASEPLYPYKGHPRERLLHRNSTPPSIAPLLPRSVAISRFLTGGRVSSFSDSGAVVHASTPPTASSAPPHRREAVAPAHVAGGPRDHLLRQRPKLLAAEPRRRRRSGHARAHLR